MPKKASREDCKDVSSTTSKMEIIFEIMTRMNLLVVYKVVWYHERKRPGAGIETAVVRTAD